MFQNIRKKTHIMKRIYILDMSFNFLLQATRILGDGNHDENDLNMIYDYVVSLDNETLNSYYDSCTLITYEHDLELYIEIVDVLIKRYEQNEEYEKCSILKNKKDESIKIIKSKI